MINGKKVSVILPAYNAEKTLRRTWDEIPKDLVDDIILVDDNSKDATVALAKSLGIITIRHERNRGYGGNQKTCYKTALERGAEIVIMLHPDYQYTPKLIPAMASLLVSGHYDVVLGSRILGGQAIRGGMPVYKYLFNRCLTWTQNILQGAKLSEYHTGYRAYRREVLEAIDWEGNSEDFVFDNEFLAQIIYCDFRIAEITCPARYFEEASSIGFRRSMVYGLGCLRVAALFRLARWGVGLSRLFNRKSIRLNEATANTFD